MKSFSTSAFYIAAGYVGSISTYLSSAMPTAFRIWLLSFAKKRRDFWRFGLDHWFHHWYLQGNYLVVAYKAITLPYCSTWSAALHVGGVAYASSDYVQRIRPRFELIRTSVLSAFTWMSLPRGLWRTSCPACWTRDETQNKMKSRNCNHRNI